MTKIRLHKYSPAVPANASFFELPAVRCDFSVCVVCRIIGISSSRDLRAKFDTAGLPEYQIRGRKIKEQMFFCRGVQVENDSTVVSSKFE